MSEFDDRAAAAADRVRGRAAEVAAANPFDAAGAGRRSGGPGDRPGRRLLAVVAAAAVVLVGVAGLIAVTDDGPDVGTDDGTSPSELTTDPDSLPVASLPAATTTIDPSTTTPTATTPPTTATPTTSVPAAPEPLLRPIIDPAICETVFAREGPTFEPFGPLTLFGRPSEFPVPIQIIGNAEQGPVGPFAIVLRYLDSERPVAGELIDVNGVAVGVTTNPNGNGEATWNLPDGSQGYLRSRGLSRDEIIAVLTTLTPRPPEAAIPGFDYGDNGPTSLEVLHERMNTDVSEGTTSSSQCTTPGPAGTISGYSVSTLVGDPVYVFGGVIDRPVPMAVGEQNGTVVVLAGLDGPDAPTVDDVIEADEALWNELRTSEVLGGPPVEPIGGDLEVRAELITFAGGDGGHLTFKLKEFEGVTFLEVYKNDAIISPDAVYWVEEIDGRRRGMSSAPGGGVAGTRLGDGPITEPFTVEVFIIDSDDLVLQTTGEIMLVPES